MSAKTREMGSHLVKDGASFSNTILKFGETSHVLTLVYIGGLENKIWYTALKILLQIPQVNGAVHLFVLQK